MFLRVDNLLNAAELQSLADIARRAKFVDGRRSNPHNTTKVNLIGDATDPSVQQAGQITMGALQRNEQAKNFVLPKRMAMPGLCRYAAGMTYGPHTDAAFLPIGQQPLRSDVSCTVFISDPAHYQGGELTVYLGTETLSIKGKPGSAVFYPSTTVHQVMPVTAGERVVMITFIESQVRDQLLRNLIYTLQEVRALEGLKMEWQNQIQLEYVIANLIRMWSG